MGEGVVIFCGGRWGGSVDGRVEGGGWRVERVEGDNMSDREQYARGKIPPITERIQERLVLWKAIGDLRKIIFSPSVKIN